MFKICCVDSIVFLLIVWPHGKSVNYCADKSFFEVIVCLRLPKNSNRSAFVNFYIPGVMKKIPNRFCLLNFGIMIFVQ